MCDDKKSKRYYTDAVDLELLGKVIPPKKDDIIMMTYDRYQRIKELCSPSISSLTCLFLGLTVGLLPSFLGISKMDDLKFSDMVIVCLFVVFSILSILYGGKDIFKKYVKNDFDRVFKEIEEDNQEYFKKNTSKI